MEKNKDVGIIGYWFATNYGGVASYYSLYKTVEELGYKPFLVENPYFETDREGYDVFPRHFFKNENMNIAQGYNYENLFQLNKLSDIFLLGSDQVLTTSSIKSFGKLFLMEFAESNKKKIAFSASCGGDNLNSDINLINYAKEQLKDFAAVSVREYSAIDLVKNKFGLFSEMVIDPIFFTSASQYKKLGEKASIKKDEPYLFAYILDPTEDKRKSINTISEHLKINFKIALDGRKFTYERNFEKMGMPNQTLPELNQYEWFNYFTNASYIITDSFHGAVMAIILNKPFIMYANRGRGYPRFITLAQIFKIYSRLIENSEELTESKIDEAVNFERINKIILQEKSKAKEWLFNALCFEPKKHWVGAYSNWQKNCKNCNECVMACPTQAISIENNAGICLPRLSFSKCNDCGKCTLKCKEINNHKITNDLSKDPDFAKICILVSLLRDYGIKHIVLSPGGRDVPLIRMFEYNENSFILHRVTDERSAGYYGLGIASQLRQPVACVCTSGTAASNYLPAVTEAFYTGVPLILITADRYDIYLNHGEDQTIPQKSIYKDVVKKEISLKEATGWRNDYQNRRDISDCILETTHNGFGPVHINVPVDNITIGANLPRDDWKLMPFIYPHILRVGVNNGDKELYKWVDSLKKSQKILIVYGQNYPITDESKNKINLFAKKYNCVIVTDHISNLDCYYCLETFNMLRAISQEEFNKDLAPDILITVGGKRLMNDPLTFKVRGGPGNIRHWVVTPDGKIKDFYFRLTSVLELSQDFFFEWFAEKAGEIYNNGIYYEKWRNLNEKFSIPVTNEFNSIYIQSSFLPKIPPNSILHLGVGQSFFECRRFPINKTVEVFCNMGTNGIDGCTSTFMGQCAVVKDKLCFLIVGDLSFFYDMNSIWNKPLSKNIRILMINNNGSGLLRGHNLKAVTSEHNTKAEGWVKSTGFEYITARTKEEFEKRLPYFLSDEPSKALFFEIFCK